MDQESSQDALHQSASTTPLSQSATTLRTTGRSGTRGVPDGVRLATLDWQQEIPVESWHGRFPQRSSDGVIDIPIAF